MVNQSNDPSRAESEFDSILEQSGDQDHAQPVYVISIAAQLASLHPQTLRQYDRIGLVSPDRTIGRNRMYSMHDIRRLRKIQALADAGFNLVGIARILELEDEVVRLRHRVQEFEQAQRSTAVVVWSPQRRR